MVDPVMAEDEHTYSRAAIQEWFEDGNQRSPMTNNAIGTKLRKNRTVQNMIDALYPHLGS
jgi:hypothetical protein